MAQQQLFYTNCLIAHAMLYRMLIALTHQ